MAVRTDLSWPWRAVIAAAFAGIVGGIWWWGYDWGHLFGGFNRRATETQVAALATDLAVAQREATELRAQNTHLQSVVAMMRGTQSTLARQQTELLAENAAMKDELSFLKSFFAEGTKTPGAASPRSATGRAVEPAERVRRASVAH